MPHPAQPSASPYRGSIKHKARPARGRKGTLCPEWTHVAGAKGLGNDMFAHAWDQTLAHVLFARAETDPSEPDRKFATERGMAFEAKQTNDGTWHGFPVPWEEVPADLKDRWLAQGTVSKKDIGRYLKFSKTDYSWPLKTDG